MAYFDYNATTPLEPTALKVFSQALEDLWANPSSPNSQSARVHNALAAARESLAQRLGKSIDELIFTGGATEANNAAIRYLVDTLPNGKWVAISSIEHPSVSEPAIKIFPERVKKLAVSRQGVVDIDHLRGLVKSGTIGAISVMAANNETGVIQPWQEIAELCRSNAILFHCDASQWFGKCSDARYNNCDLLVGCAHKFGGPKGAGFLALSPNSLGFRSQLGGEQEFGKRGGTENVPAILSMVAAFEYAEARLEIMKIQADFRDRFETTLGREIRGFECIGNTVARVPNTSFFLVPRFENLRWVRKLDVRGYQVSTGSACSTGTSSSVLHSMGYSVQAGRQAIRVSSGPFSSDSDWLGLTEAFLQVWAELQKENQSGGSEIITL